MYTFTSRVRFSETDEEERLSLGAIMNYFQDCCSFHAQEVHAGSDWMRQRDRLWLLNSWQIILLERPRCNEYIQVSTEPYAFKGTLGMRNFRIRTADGRDCVLANSNWFLIQPSTMRPVRVTKEDMEPYVLGDRLEMDYADRKIALPKEGTVQEPVVVLPEHIDSNHHVNNTQYVLMARRYLPEGFVLRQVRAEYRYQALLGDIIVPVVTVQENQTIVQLKKEDGTAYAVVAFS